MRWVPTKDAVQLLLEGQIALSEVEDAGCRVNKEYVEKAYADAQARIRDLESQMRLDPFYDRWRRRFGDKTNVGSPEQLAKIVFSPEPEGLGYKPPKQTDSGKRASAAESALESVPEPFIKKLYLPAQKLRKAAGTYLAGLLREMVQHADGLWYVHPSYNLNTVETFRSSCDNPNYQNQPARNPEISRIIRESYIPRPGHQILELDYGQIEVRIPPCYNFDPTLTAYVCDPTKDMHRDMAAQVCFLDNKQVSKDLRSHVKNKLVFPLFYGSYYAQVAPAVWEAFDRFDLKVEGSGVPIKEHLAGHGIEEFSAFENYLKEVEEDFWGRRFKVYADWKKRWIEDYYREGGCRFLTGFVMSGPHKRNDITNYCIQGVAFHCLLWSLIKIVRWLRKNRMRTRVIGEIHDSLVFDAHPAERDAVLHYAIRTMTEEIKAWAPWLVVPLVAEPECCPIDGSWYEKAALVEKDGRFVPAKMDAWLKKYGPWEKQVVA